MIFELSAGNAAAYLGHSCRAAELGGGVSNTVLLIETDTQRFILKQSLAKLRVKQDWFSDRRRIFRESSAMRRLAPLLPPGSIPDVLWEDRVNFIFAMSAAPAGARTWKDLLLEGQLDPATPEAVGRMLRTMITSTPDMREEFADQTIFDELRLDPYYRSTALRHPDLALFFDRLIERSAGRGVSLVHGDWSPKNFLVSSAGVMAIDFEVVHFGDPSFDAAFLLNHLLLKSFYRPQWRDQYREAARRFWSALGAMPDWFEPATVEHLGGLMLARIDGKSPVEYIRDAGLKQRIRMFAREIIGRTVTGYQPLVDVFDQFPF